MGIRVRQVPRLCLRRRFLVSCELDTAFFHLYGVNRDVVGYIMETFPIVKRKDEAKFEGRYRTKDTILDIYDAMQQAIAAGLPYQTVLDPAPADPSVSHSAEGTNTGGSLVTAAGER